MLDPIPSWSPLNHDAESVDNNKRIFVITPTVRTLVRLADMTRLSQTLAHVPNVIWVVVEHGLQADPAVWELLYRKERTLGLKSVYLACDKDPAERTRGFSERNGGLQWVLDQVWPEPMDDGQERDKHLKYKSDPSDKCNSTCVFIRKSPQINLNKGDFGAVYFADDDNAYDAELLNEIRLYGRYISLFPVGAFKAGVVSPIVKVKENALLGFFDHWAQSGRSWPVDMAEFALDLKYMYDVNKFRSAWYVPCCKTPGYGEDLFLKRFGHPKDNKFTILCNNAQLVRVWHVKTANPKPECTVPDKLLGVNLNIEELLYTYTDLFNIDKQCSKPPFIWLFP